jgi:hypothetical protein
MMTVVLSNHVPSFPGGGCLSFYNISGELVEALIESICESCAEKTKETPPRF